VHEHVPGQHRGEDQRVQRPASTGLRVVHQAEPAEVDLALHPRLAVRDPQRRLPPAEAALLFTGGDVTAGGLALHPSPLRRDPQPRARQPGPQHLAYFDHAHLSERHSIPPRST
jgi:hypothetical protein